MCLCTVKVSSLWCVHLWDILTRLVPHFPPNLALCEAEQVVDTSHGTYNWPVTRAEISITLSCQYGAAAEGSTVPAMATRQCDLRGRWSESNFSQCASFTDSTLRNISMVCAVVSSWCG